ncbi:hypothetical protein KIPB_015926, partial [Kipferlia bialata]
TYNLGIKDKYQELLRKVMVQYKAKTDKYESKYHTLQADSQKYKAYYISHQRRLKQTLAARGPTTIAAPASTATASPPVVEADSASASKDT